LLNHLPETLRAESQMDFTLALRKLHEADSNLIPALD